jgi:pimeloyl-ACP methyl ester carboxylesterase
MKPVKLLLSTMTISLILSACNNQASTKEMKQADSNDSMHIVRKENTFTKNGYSEVNGIRMYYEIYGEGHPLVLIHGAGSTIQTSFGRIIPALSKSYQIIAVELQAHGRTSDRNTGLSFEQDADDVASLLGNLKITKADFLGFSNGANTALQIAIRHPQITNKVIAASALLKRNGTVPQFWESMKHAKFEEMPQQYKDAFLKVTPDSSKLYNMFHKCVTRMLNFKDMPDEQIKSIKCPVLLVNGDADVATSEHVVQMSRLIPNCKLAIIPGTHGEYMGEIATLKPGKVNTNPILPIVSEFLSR